MNRFFVVALMATCFAANAALETIPLTTNESGRVGWEIGLARSNINEMVELIPELDSKIDSASNTMASAVALKQDALPQAGHGELLYSLFGFPAWLDGASSYAIMMHNGTTINWLDKPAGETGSGLLAFGQTNGLHWTGNGYPYSYNGEVAARMKIPASDLSTDYEDGFYGVTVQNGEISFGEIQDPETITNDWSEVIAAIPVGDPNALSGNLLVTSTAPLTLVVSNGLVYAVLPNGDLVDVTYYLPAYAVTEPTTNYPAGFAAFDFEAGTTNVSDNAPQIAEWTRIGDPGDALAISAEGLDASSIFVFTDSSGTTLAGDVVSLDDQLATVIIPSGLATNDVYLMHPFNSSGFGYPVLVNGVDSWWLGNSPAAATETFRVYGTGLAMAGESAWVYIVGYGWLESTNANPFMAEFVVPALANGTYAVYPHNGHGGKYNFGDALSLDVDSTVLIDWGAGSTLNVTNYGGVGDGVTDNATAIASMISASSAGKTLYFPAGTYATSVQIELKTGTRILGDGMDATTILRATNAAANLFINPAGDRTFYQDVTFSSGASSTSCFPVFINNKNNTRFLRVRVDERLANTQGCRISASSGQTTLFKDCEFIVRQNICSKSGVTFVGSSFFGCYDNNRIFSGWLNDGVSNISFIACSASPEDNSVPSNGAGWAKGRWIGGTGSPMNWYVGDCTSTNMCPRPSSGVDQNSGEQIMFESLVTKYRGTASSADADTITLPDIETNYAGRVVVVVDGRGVGQSRIISSVDTTTGVVAVGKPWDVVPDDSSVCMVGSYGYQLAVYGNSFHGSERTSDPAGFPNIFAPGYTNYTATTAVSLFGGFEKAVVANNRAESMNTGFCVWSVASKYGSSATRLWQPTFFNIFSNNTITNCLRGLLTEAGLSGTGTALFEDNVIIGTTWRRNSLDGITGAGINIVSDVFINDGINNNTYDRTIFGTVENLISVDGLSYNNLFIAATNSIVSYDASGVTYFDVFAAPPQLQIPQGTVLLSDASKTIDLYNVGTTGLTWTATDNAAWLSVTDSGSIAAESSGTMTLSRSGSTTNGATALVSIVAAGQTNVFTVIYGDELGVE